MHIIARKRRDVHGTEYVVMDRGDDFQTPYVVATIPAGSREPQLDTATYFVTRAAALTFFASRPEYREPVG